MVTINHLWLYKFCTYLLFPSLMNTAKLWKRRRTRRPAAVVQRGGSRSRASRTLYKQLETGHLVSAQMAGRGVTVQPRRETPRPARSRLET